MRRSELGSRKAAGLAHGRGACQEGRHALEQAPDKNIRLNNITSDRSHCCLRLSKAHPPSHLLLWRSSLTSFGPPTAQESSSSTLDSSRTSPYTPHNSLAQPYSWTTATTAPSPTTCTGRTYPPFPGILAASMARRKSPLTPSHPVFHHRSAGTLPLSTL